MTANPRSLKDWVWEKGKALKHEWNLKISILKKENDESIVRICL